jgi:hypothetical protein
MNQKQTIQQFLARQNKISQPVRKPKITKLKKANNILENWIYLPVEPIPKKLALDRTRFVFATGDERETPTFKTYCEAVSKYLPDIGQEDLNYIQSQEYELIVDFSNKLTNGSSFVLIEPFLRVISSKYKINRCTLSNILTKITAQKKVGNPSIKFRFNPINKPLLTKKEGCNYNKTMELF